MRDRLTTTYEMVFLLTRSERYYFDLDAIRIPVKHPNDPRRRRTTTGSARGHDPTRPAGKNPGDVWSFATRPLREAHFAAYPIEIPLRCIAAGCRPGGTVLDPFSGAATTGLAALQLGRHYIGIDLSQQYTAIAKQRILQSPHSPATEEAAERPGNSGDVVPSQPTALDRRSASSASGPGCARRDHRLDAFTPPRVDRRPQPAPPADANGDAAETPAHQVRDAERTADPCPRYPHSEPESVPTDATGHRRSADRDTAARRPGPSDAAGRR